MVRINLLSILLIYSVLLASCGKENLPTSQAADNSINAVSQSNLKCGSIGDLQKIEKNLMSKNAAVSAILFGSIDKNGKMDFATEGEIAPSDLIYAASPGSKGVTTFLLLKEKVDIDQTIEKWFPLADGYQASNKITIKMLLSHKSGIKDFVFMLPADTSLSTAKIVDYAYKNVGLQFEPGKYWCYSNTGFVMAGMILEKITGKTYAQLLKKHFGKIAPSLFIMGETPFTVAKAYLPMPFNPTLPKFAGGLVGSSIDLLKAFRYIYSQPEYRKMQDFVAVPQFGVDCSDCFCNYRIYADVYGVGTARYTFDKIGVFTGADGDMAVGFPQLFTKDGSVYLINTIVSQFQDMASAINLKKEHASALLSVAVKK